MAISDFPRVLTHLRKEAGISQKKAAESLGISQALLSHYEKGIRECGLIFLVRAADFYGVSVDYLLTENDEFVLQAGEQYGSKGKRDARELMDEVSGLFAGGDLADEDLDEMMRGIQEAYWIAKEKNKKYTPKKFIKEND